MAIPIDLYEPDEKIYTVSSKGEMHVFKVQDNGYLLEILLSEAIDDEP